MENVIIFGRYPQTENGGVQPIEWLVLKREENKALLVSKCALFAAPFDSIHNSAAWLTSSIRNTLNGEFYKMAFSDKERAAISPTFCDNPINCVYGTPGGRGTVDSVFLLSIQEANELFVGDDEENDERIFCELTPYAKKSGCAKEKAKFSIEGNCCWWWLRTPGSDSNKATAVDVDGFAREAGVCVNNGSLGVRPALWVNLEAEIFRSEITHDADTAPANLKPVTVDGLIAALTEYAEGCSWGENCHSCSWSSMCEDGYTPKNIAALLKKLKHGIVPNNERTILVRGEQDDGGDTFVMRVRLLREPLDVEDAMFEAVKAYIHTEDGFRSYDANGERFNWYDCQFIPNEICRKCGFEIIRSEIHENDYFVNGGENLIFDRDDLYFHVTNIVWDTDGENIDLPAEVDITFEELSDGDYSCDLSPDILRDRIADWLSDAYGFLVKSFNSD